jgi:hypothetical protein
MRVGCVCTPLVRQRWPTSTGATQSSIAGGMLAADGRSPLPTVIPPRRVPVPNEGKTSWVAHKVAGGLTRPSRLLLSGRRSTGISSTDIRPSDTRLSDTQRIVIHPIRTPPTSIRASRAQSFELRAGAMGASGPPTDGRPSTPPVVRPRARATVRPRAPPTVRSRLRPTPAAPQPIQCLAIPLLAPAR